MVRLTLFFVLVVAASPAASQTLYRCPGQGTNGATLIQDRPCPDGRPAATQLDAREVSVSPQRQRQLVQQRARNAQAISSAPRQHYRSSYSRQLSPAQLRRVECDSAKRNRDARRQALGLNRTYESLAALDRNVRRACKDVR